MPIIEIILFVIIFVWLWIIGGKLNTDEKEIINHGNRLDKLETKVDEIENK